MTLFLFQNILGGSIYQYEQLIQFSWHLMLVDLYQRKVLRLSNANYFIFFISSFDHNLPPLINLMPIDRRVNCSFKCTCTCLLLQVALDISRVKNTRAWNWTKYTRGMRALSKPRVKCAPNCTRVTYVQQFSDTLIQINLVKFSFPMKTPRTLSFINLQNFTFSNSYSNIFIRQHGLHEM